MNSTNHSHQGHYLTPTMAHELVDTTYGSHSSMPWPNQGPFSSDFMLGNQFSEQEEKEGLAKRGGEDQQDEDDDGGEDEEELGVMKEMMFKMAAMQPVEIDPATIQKPRRRNVRISNDPQSVVARLRRERISEKIRILQRLVPGGTKMDTASMLDEAIRYVKFLKRQIRQLNST